MSAYTNSTQNYLLETETTSVR